jgi:ABC-type antimicrobial peptide transport system permease subunit
MLRVAHVYLPLREGDASQLRFLVRASAGDPITLASLVTNTLVAVDPDVALMTPVPLGQLVRDGAGNLRWFATIFSGFGAVALLLSAIGIYGVIAWSVGRRTREIGLRIALGATQLSIFRLLLGSVARPAGIGLTLGILGALGLGVLLQSLLFGVSPRDPSALLSSLLGFLLTITLAAGLPARRATQIDPLQATHSD